MRRFLKYIFHNIICFTLLRCRLDLLLQKRSKSKRLIIMYHGVRSGPRSINGRHVTATMFEKQIRYFKKRFDIVPLTQLCEMKAKGIVPMKHTIALTFDDGFLNNVTTALPLLEKYRIPATFFICTAGVVDSQYGHPTDRVDLIKVASKPEEIRIRDKTFYRKGHRVVDNDGINAYEYINTLTFEQWLIANNELGNELDGTTVAEHKELYQLISEREMTVITGSELLKVASHSHHHISFSMLTQAETFYQLSQSKAILQSYGPVDTIAFPYGAYNDRTIATAKEVGYKYMIAGGHVDAPYNNDIFPRIGVLDGAGFSYTMLTISNGFKRFGF